MQDEKYVFQAIFRQNKRWLIEIHDGEVRRRILHTSPGAFSRVLRWHPVPTAYQVAAMVGAMMSADAIPAGFTCP